MYNQAEWQMDPECFLSYCLNC
uniref:Uncharacterized protein n=1 Tax=Rhizophora mucronata TaxID=61149 RepID=A0A2P2QSB9_RHIMU